MSGLKYVLSSSAVILSVVSLSYGSLMAIGEVLPPPLPDYAKGLGLYLLSASILFSALVFIIAKKFLVCLNWQSYFSVLLVIGSQLMMGLLLTGG